MKLADALKILQHPPAGAGEAYNVSLVCGCTPSHLQTFLGAHLQLRLPERRVAVRTGLYGDCLGHLERVTEAGTDAAAVVLEWADLDPRLGLRRTGGWSPRHLPDILATVRERLEGFQAGLARAAALVPVVVCLPTIPLPPVSYHAGWELDDFGLDLRERLNAFARRLVQGAVRVVSPQRLDRLSPPGERLDVRAELMFGFPYRPAHASEVAGLLARLLQPPAPKKGLITDLDDTLWRGLVGEAGADGVSWDLDRYSHMHALYQQLLRSLADAGVLLAVASKNDPGRVEEAFRRDDLLVGKEHFFPVQVGWGLKSDAVAEVLRAWNVGADSVVFVDDSPMELAEVKARHPAVECLRFPTQEDQGVYGLLEELRDLFGKPRISEEDSLRLRSIREAAHPATGLPRAGSNMDAFLVHAGPEVTVCFAKEPADPRALELVNKTNQFNLNGRRYTEQAWLAFLRGPDTFLAVVSYRDRFGPLGKIAVLGGRRQGSKVWVDTWVMSCRAFARRIEHCCAEVLFAQFGSDELVLDVLVTARNQPLLSFLEEFGRGELGSAFRLSREAFSAHCPPLVHKVTVQHHE